MFSRSEIDKFLFFDVETAGSEADFEYLPERMQQLWSKRCEYLRKLERFPENANMNDSDLFQTKAGLHPEFGRIVCISFGKVKFPDDPTLVPQVQIVSYAGQDEVEILRKSIKLFNGMYKNKVVPFGHNIKRFDVPYICKRSFINGLEPPVPFQTWDKKPWEIDIKDSADLWSFGAWQEGFTSLDLLTASLGLPSPKDEMTGDQVHENFYQGNIGDIQTYCNKDVIALIRVAFALSKLDQFDDSDIIFK